MCDKDVNTYYSTIQFVPECYKTQLVYCSNRYKTQRMCDEADNDSLAPLNLFLIGLLKVKCLKN